MFSGCNIVFGAPDLKTDRYLLASTLYPHALRGGSRVGLAGLCSALISIFKFICIARQRSARDQDYCIQVFICASYLVTWSDHDQRYFKWNWRAGILTWNINLALWCVQRAQRYEWHGYYELYGLHGPIRNCIISYSVYRHVAKSISFKF